MVRIASFVALGLFASAAFAQAPAAPAGPAQPKITYDDHVRQIFKDHCFACHAQDRAKGGLVLVRNAVKGGK